jgi:hypothetical protein
MQRGIKVKISTKILFITITSIWLIIHNEASAKSPSFNSISLFEPEAIDVLTPRKINELELAGTFTIEEAEPGISINLDYAITEKLSFELEIPFTFESPVIPEIEFQMTYPWYLNSSKQLILGSSLIAEIPISQEGLWVLAGSVNYVQKFHYTLLVSEVSAGITQQPKIENDEVDPLVNVSAGPYFRINRFSFGIPLFYIYETEQNIALVGAEADYKITQDLIIQLWGAIPYVGDFDNALLFAGLRGDF